MGKRHQPLAVGKGFGIRKRQSQNVASVVHRRADEVESGREADRGFGMLIQNSEILQMSVAVAYGARQRDRGEELLEGLALILEGHELGNPFRDAFVGTIVATMGTQAV